MYIHISVIHVCTCKRVDTCNTLYVYIYIYIHVFIYMYMHGQNRCKTCTHEFVYVYTRIRDHTGAEVYKGPRQVPLRMPEKDQASAQIPLAVPAPPVGPFTFWSQGPSSGGFQNTMFRRILTFVAAWVPTRCTLLRTENQARPCARAAGPFRKRPA